MLVFGGGILGLIFILIWAYAILDVITTDSSDCRNLPKFAWLIIVILLPEIGSLAWFLAGRPQRVRYRPASTAAPMGIEDRPDWPARADEILNGPSKEEIRKAADERTRKLREWEARLIKREKELDDERRKHDEGNETS